MQMSDEKVGQDNGDCHVPTSTSVVLLLLGSAETRYNIVET